MSPCLFRREAVRRVWVPRGLTWVFTEWVDCLRAACAASRTAQAYPTALPGGWAFAVFIFISVSSESSPDGRGFSIGSEKERKEKEK